MCLPQSFEEATKADEIFIGVLTKSEQDWGTTHYFDVLKKWKGKEHAKAVIVNIGTSCDFSFDRIGQQYLIFAESSSFEDCQEDKSMNCFLNAMFSKTFDTSLCSRTSSAYSRIFRDDNWFKADQILLDKMFPEPIPLRTIPRSFLVMIVSLLGGIVLLSFWGVRK